MWASLFALLASVGSMASAALLNDFDLHTMSHISSVMWLTLSLGLVAWMKVKVSHAQFGSVSRSIRLVVTLTKQMVLTIVGMLYGRPDTVSRVSPLPFLACSD